MAHNGRHLLIASLPAALTGVFNLGSQIRAATTDPADVWQLALLADLGISADPTDAISFFLTGAVFWLPLLVCSLIVGLGWSVVFARSRGRSVDPVWIPAAWLFSLMLPATVPIGFAALALSFGLVFGCHVFGGSDRYLVNPALLGVIFLAIGYPALTGTTAWLPGSDNPTTWSAVAAAADSAPVLEASVLGVFFGTEIGAIGTASALACLLGAAYLVAARVIPVSLVVSGLLALIVLGGLGSEVPWAWHLAAGNFAFALAFVATDPTARPTTAGGSWAFGALFGALVIALRGANPDHPEGTWAALLLASLSIPLLDHIARAISIPRKKPSNV
jgi:Na+-transporting NADH:ubiquinone oxidoreductase subunit B